MKILFTKICEECGNEFETASNRAKYCFYCRDKVQVRRNKAYAEKKKSGEAVSLGSKQICPLCNKEYKVTSGSQKYCKECSEKQRKSKATAPGAEYLKGHYDYIRINVPKGERDSIKEYAQSQGLSVNKLFLIALEEYMQNHSEKQE